MTKFCHRCGREIEGDSCAKVWLDKERFVFRCIPCDDEENGVTVRFLRDQLTGPDDGGPPRQRRARLIGLDTAAIAARIYGKGYTRANIVSLQRALRTLEGKGAIGRVGRIFGHHQHWRLRS
jgi:hypothetical protein